MSNLPLTTDHDDDEHDLGLAHDLGVMRRLGVIPALVGAVTSSAAGSALYSRRRAFGILGLGALALAGCGSAAKSVASAGSSSTTAAASGSTATTAASGSTTSAASGTVAEIPDETGGPYPGDGTNGPNVLNQSGVVRQDIRSSFGSYSGTAEGVQLDLALTFVDTSTGKPLTGAAIYIWHAERGGEYSLYGRNVTNQNYLRGIQVTDDAGKVSFTSIFPSAYSGRWPHIHFEVFTSLADAAAGKNKLKTSQMALPEAACKAAYAATGYEQSVKNLASSSLARDNVFSDGYALEMATVTGSNAAGWKLTHTIGI